MASPEGADQLVVFSLNGEWYGLPIASVREIIRYTPPGATAAASGPIRGLINLRGRMLPVVDLSPRLGGQLEIGARTRILIIEVSNGTLGLIVDDVDGILRVRPEQIEALPVAANRELGDQIAAIGDRLIMLIDAERALGELLPARKPPARRRRAGSTRPRASS